MSKKKKHPVMKMTEEDYANYIMSLKDESPIKPVKPEKDSWRNKTKKKATKQDVVKNLNK